MSNSGKLNAVHLCTKLREIRVEWRMDEKHQQREKEREKNQQQQNKSKNEPNIVWYVDSFDDVNDERIICVLLYVNTLIKSLNSNYISNYLLDSK